MPKFDDETLKKRAPQRQKEAKGEILIVGDRTQEDPYISNPDDAPTIPAINAVVFVFLAMMLRLS